MLRRRQIKMEHLWVAAALIAGMLIRMAGMKMTSGDANAFLLPWYEQLCLTDLKTALTSQVGDYNMLYQLLIFVMTRLPGDPLVQYKLLSICFDLSLAAGSYALMKEISDSRRASAAFSLVFLLPTVWLDSAFWAQCDSIYVSWIIWALYCLRRKKTVRAFVLLGIAFAFKLQAIFIMPFIGFLFLAGIGRKEGAEEQKTCRGLRGIRMGFIKPWHFLVLLGSYAATAIPNLLAGRPLMDLIRIYADQTNIYPQMFVNYPSIWSIIPLHYDTGKTWSILLTCLLLLLIFVWLYRRKADLWGEHFLWAALLTSYTCVFFLPAMHERYDYLYMVLALLLVLRERRGWLPLIVLQFVSVRYYERFLWGSRSALNGLAVFNLLIYALVCYGLYLKLNGRLFPCTLFEREQEEKPENSPVQPGARRLTVTDWKRVLLLTFAFFLVGSMQLGSMSAPRTFCELGGDGNEKEVIISLSKNEPVDALYIYTGRTAEYQVRGFTAENKAWEPLSEEAIQLKSVFSWNKVPINRTTYQIALIFTGNGAAEIGQIACFGRDGKQLEVSGKEAFRQLFDEQSSIAGIPTFYDKTMFDEVYHGRTAYEYLHGLPIYENSHPPLGKLLIALGIAVFGMTPFGYRIVPLLFGTAMIPLICVFAMRLTGKRKLAFLAGILLGSEFMHYTLSRIATIDIIVAFFVLALYDGVFAYFQEGKVKYLLLAGLAASLGAATKWTAVYALTGMAVILLPWLVCGWLRAQPAGKERRHLAAVAGVCLLSFCLLPVAVYVLSYAPMASIEPGQGMLGHAVSNSLHMFEYHSNAFAHHPYESRWYEWLIDQRPLLDSWTALGDKRSVVSTFVNPLVCFGGLAALTCQLFLAIRKKDKVSVYLLVFYGCMLIPWIFIARTTFIYQYFICTQVLILMICHAISQLRFRNEDRVIGAVALASVFLFMMFFPVISGLEVPAEYIDSMLMISPSWVF